jgi:hypothetical protein
MSIGSPVKDNLRHDSREELSRQLLILDFIMFTVENAASQTWALPNNDITSREKFRSLGNS